MPNISFGDCNLEMTLMSRCEYVSIPTLENRLLQRSSSVMMPISYQDVSIPTLENRLLQHPTMTVIWNRRFSFNSYPRKSLIATIINEPDNLKNILFQFLPSKIAYCNMHSQERSRRSCTRFNSYPRKSLIAT